MPTARAGVRRLTLVAVLAASTAAVLAVPGSDVRVAVAAPQAPVSQAPPNIVYVVVDDLSSNIVQYMANVGTLADHGVTFDDYIVTDSQCCPSRASTMSGLYPHNSKVLTNTWPDGGFDRFQQKQAATSMGPRLSDEGYRTGFIGKYLNGYEPEGTSRKGGRDAPAYPAGFVPAGWDEWHVAGDGYPNFDYTLADAVDQPVATLNEYGHDPEDYLTDVLSQKSTEFLDRAAVAGQPFFLTIAPFATHSRVGPSGVEDDSLFPPAPRDRSSTTDEDIPDSWPPPDFPDGDCGSIAGGCAAVPFPDPADAGSFNKAPKHAPPWMGDHHLRKRQVNTLRDNYLDRIRMAQAVDDLVGKLTADLDRLKLSDDTYVVFTSDNGYHLGDHGLRRGKNSAFDSDIRVPLIVVPPGGTRAATVPAMVQNTDFLPTFLDIAGNPKPERNTDGESLLPFLTDPGQEVRGWREGALVQYATGGKDSAEGSPQAKRRGDPDTDSTGSPPPYFALRADGYVYVDYSKTREVPRNRNGEFYDLVNDPNATVNRYGDLSELQKRQLARAVHRYQDCSGGACAAAGRRMPDITLR